MKMQKAAITVYLSLVWILLIAFIGSVLESASLQVGKNYKRADVERAMECVFAEYQKELFEEYGIFAMDGSYESENYEERLIMDRINFYAGGNEEHAIERIKFLSDDEGMMFYDQVCTFMEQKYGISFLKDKIGMTSFWKTQEDLVRDLQLEGTEHQSTLEQLLAENETEIVDTNTVFGELNRKINSPILSQVMPAGKNVSEKEINLSDTLSKRKCNKGYGVFENERERTTLSVLLFGEYLLEQFASAVNHSGNVLHYEIEYLLGGKESDRENLEIVVRKLLWFRLVPNYALLQGDAGKRAEAEALAAAVCTLLTVPMAIEVAAQMILFFWAYEESLIDIQKLLAGEKIPLLANGRNALSYKEYLRILLFLEKKETLCMRALDLIEINLRNIHGQTFFQADQCVVKMEILSICRLRRGIIYQFRTCRMYQ